MRYYVLKSWVYQTVSNMDFRHFSQNRQKSAVQSFVAKPVGIVFLGEEYLQTAIFRHTKGITPKCKTDFQNTPTVTIFELNSGRPNFIAS
jgi:hypothetical protein